MKIFDDVSLILVYAFGIVIVLFFLVLSFLIGGWIISKIIDFDSYAKPTSKIKKIIIQFAFIIFSTLLGFYILSAASKLRCSSSNEDEEIIMKRD